MLSVGQEPCLPGRMQTYNEILRVRLLKSFRAKSLLKIWPILLALQQRKEQKWEGVLENGGFEWPQEHQPYRRPGRRLVAWFLCLAERGSAVAAFGKNRDAVHQWCCWDKVKLYVKLVTQNKRTGTPAWLLPAGTTASCWDGTLGAEGWRCQENIHCGESRMGTTVMPVEVVN